MKRQSNHVDGGGGDGGGGGTDSMVHDRGLAKKTPLHLLITPHSRV